MEVFMTIPRQAIIGAWEQLQIKVPKQLKLTLDDFSNLEQHELDESERHMIAKRFPGQKAVKVLVSEGIKVIYTNGAAMIIIAKENYARG